jgi:hypothetical protein
MSRFEVFSGTTLIGYSDLESGDPPMGVALGRFTPLPSYASIKKAVVAARERDQSDLCLSVRASNGLILPAQNGVQILDFSAELGAEELEVHVVGIGYPLYQELFPSHVKTYENQFKNVG